MYIFITGPAALNGLHRESCSNHPVARLGGGSGMPLREGPEGPRKGTHRRGGGAEWGRTNCMLEEKGIGL